MVTCLKQVALLVSSHMTSQVVLKPAPVVLLSLPAEHGIPATGDLASKIIVSGFSCTALELIYAHYVYFISKVSCLFK